MTAKQFLTEKNGRWLYNGKTYAECSDREQITFNQIISLMKEQYKRTGRAYELHNGKYEILWDDSIDPIGVKRIGNYLTDKEFKDLLKFVRKTPQTLEGRWDRNGFGVWEFVAEPTELLYETDTLVDCSVKIKGYRHLEDVSGTPKPKTQNYYFQYEFTDDDCNSYKISPQQEAQLEKAIIENLNFEGVRDYQDTWNECDPNYHKSRFNG